MVWDYLISNCVLILELLQSKSLYAVIGSKTCAVLIL